MKREGHSRTMTEKSGAGGVGYICEYPRGLLVSKGSTKTIRAGISTIHEGDKEKIKE